MPFLVRWPERVKPGIRCTDLSVDLIASFAALVGSPLNDPRARDSENTLPALLGTSPRGRSVLVEQAGSLSVQARTVEVHRPEQGTENQREHEDRARQRCGAATLRPGRRPWRTHQSRRETTGEGTRARRAARRHTASWRTARSPQTPEHRPGDCRRLVVPARGNLWRCDRRHTPFRSHRARGRSLHARLRRRPVLHTVAGGASHRPGRPSSSRRGQPARVPPTGVLRLSRSAGSGWLRRRT